MDSLQKLLHEVAAQDTELNNALPRPRPPTSDDTIAVQWTPAESSALTPIKKLPALPITARTVRVPALAALPALPVANPPTVPPLPGIGLTDSDIWNAAVIACEIVVTTTLGQCISDHVDIYDLKDKVITAIKSRRKAVSQPAPQPFDDDGHAR